MGVGVGVGCTITTTITIQYNTIKTQEGMYVTLGR